MAKKKQSKSVLYEVTAYSPMAKKRIVLSKPLTKTKAKAFKKESKRIFHNQQLNSFRIRMFSSPKSNPTKQQARKAAERARAKGKRARVMPTAKGHEAFVDGKRKKPVKKKKPKAKPKPKPKKKPPVKKKPFPKKGGYLVYGKGTARSFTDTPKKLEEAKKMFREAYPKKKMIVKRVKEVPKSIREMRARHKKLEKKPKPKKKPPIKKKAKPKPKKKEITKADLIMVKWPRFNKRSTIKQYENELVTGKVDTLRTLVTEVKTLDKKQWDEFTNNFLEIRKWLAGKGGSSSLAKGLPEDKSYHELTEPQKEQWKLHSYTKAIEVRGPGKKKIYVDPQGHDYARYVGFPMEYTVVPETYEKPVPEKKEEISEEKLAELMTEKLKELAGPEETKPVAPKPKVVSGKKYTEVHYKPYAERTGKLKPSDIPTIVKKIMPINQQRIIVGSEEHWEIIGDLDIRVQEIPKLYAQEKLGKKAIVYLHYFYGGSDWFITEWDGKDTFFGYAILNQDYEMSEHGYVNRTEIVDSPSPVELDFFWKKIPLDQALYDVDKDYFPLDEKPNPGKPKGWKTVDDDPSGMIYESTQRFDRVFIDKLAHPDEESNKYHVFTSRDDGTGIDESFKTLKEAKESAYNWMEEQATSNPTKAQARATAKWHRQRGKLARVMRTADDHSAFIGGKRMKPAKIKPKPKPKVKPKVKVKKKPVPVKKEPEQKRYVHMHDDTKDKFKYQEIKNVYDFIYKDLNLFAHRVLTSKKWTVTEFSTGMALVLGEKTKERAIEKAKELVDERGADGMKKLIKIAKAGVKEMKMKIPMEKLKFKLTFGLEKPKKPPAKPKPKVKPKLKPKPVEKPKPAKPSEKQKKEVFKKLLGKVEKGDALLFSGNDYGLPTIQSIKEAEHVGYGLFEAPTPSGGKVSFDGGSAMHREEGIISWTHFEGDVDDYGYDWEGVKKKLSELAGIKPKPKPVEKPKPAEPVKEAVSEEKLADIMTEKLAEMLK